MTDIIQFVPKKDAEAAANVAAFIDLCRNQLKIFGEKLDFDSNAWDVTNYIEKKGRGKTRFRLVFSNYDTSRKGLGPPMSEPFLSFAKSYIRYLHGIRPSKSIQHTISSLRALERALCERDGIAVIEKADAEIFTNAANLAISKFPSQGVRYHVGRSLGEIAEFCTENDLTIVPINWRSHIKRQQDRNRIGIEADKLRKKRFPSDAALEALPRAFHLASSAPDIIVTSVAAILCGSPDRINEVLALPVDCEVMQKLDNGKTAYGLRWWPSKGADPMVKWIVPTMVDVVKEAIRRVREITTTARQIAKWYEEHPQQIYLPKEFEHLREKQTVHLDDVVILFGKYDRSYAKKWLLSKGITSANWHCAFADLERIVIGLLPAHFPLLVRETNIKYSQALFVVRHNELRNSPNYCMFEPVRVDFINDGLGGRIQHGVKSVFSRHGFTEPDGSPIKVTTHQFRHYLDTLAQKGGLSQIDIAKWAGRKDIRQNEAYDHMSGDELIAKLREVAGDEANTFGLPVKLPERTPISYEQFLSLQIPAAHVTELGYCIHDWTFLPCQLHRDCIHCSEHCFIKGDPTRTKRIKQCLAMALQQLTFAEDALRQKFAGADRWTEHQRATVEKLKNLCEILENPKVPNRALIRLATTEEPSQIRIAIENRKQLEDKKKKTLPKRKTI